MNFQIWKKAALGRKINVDKAFGDQCVDVAMDYAQSCFPVPWNKTLGYGNAKDLFNAASPSYFAKVNSGKQGDLVVYGAFKGNPYGHIAVVDSVISQGLNVIEQDGFNPAGACYEKFRAFNALPIIGYLRPKLSPVQNVIRKVITKPPVPVQYYIVHLGDTVTAICKRFGLSIPVFQKLNPSIKDINKIAANQKVRVK